MATWKELDKFCNRYEMELYRNTDHLFYRKKLPNGDLIRTKVSKGTGEIPHGTFHHILKHQLNVSEQFFKDLIKG